MKNYEIEIYESGLHGRNKANKIFSWNLNADSISQVKSFALEILAGMTFVEVYGDIPILYGFERIPNDNGTFKLRKYQADEILGYENAEKRFTIKARVAK